MILVSDTEVGTGPPGPARARKFYERPGPARPENFTSGPARPEKVRKKLARPAPARKAGPKSGPDNFEIKWVVFAEIMPLKLCSNYSKNNMFVKKWPGPARASCF